MRQFPNSQKLSLCTRGTYDAVPSPRLILDVPIPPARLTFPCGPALDARPWTLDCLPAPLLHPCTKRDFSGLGLASHGQFARECANFFGTGPIFQTHIRRSRSASEFRVHAASVLSVEFLHPCFPYLAPWLLRFFAAIRCFPLGPTWSPKKGGDISERRAIIHQS
jgi:hypothetical protein